jgi:hypothetical protein
MSYNVFGSHGQASTAPTISIPAVAFAVISPLIVAVRFWSRMRLHTKLGADDWCILAALVSIHDHQPCCQILISFKIFALAMQGVLIGGKFHSRRIWKKQALIMLYSMPLGIWNTRKGSYSV